VAGELHHQIAGETMRAFHENGSRSVSEDTLQDLRETRALADRVCAADCRVVKGVDDLETRPFGVNLDGRELALVAVLIRAGVCLARGPQIGDGLPDFPTHFRSPFNYMGANIAQETRL
jgi:hypothetical protein